MAFGQRQAGERRNQNRRRTLKRAELIFNNRNSLVTGLVRNLSPQGAKFTLDAPVNLPRHVNLRLSNGEAFEAEIIWEKDQMEIGLKFVDDTEVASSQAYSAAQSIIALTDSRSPAEIFRLLRHLQFLGDPDLQNLADNYLSAYEKFSEALRSAIED